MRAKVLISLVGALIATVALASASGAATAKAQKVTRIDVSTRAAVIHYLRSIHVNPKGAVIQRGGLNYAGKRCPGVRWTCASTRHTVVQIAKRGGVNRFVCRSSKCVVVQLSGVSHGVYIGGRTLAATTASKGNSATCIKMGSGATTGGGQSCLITQTSGPGPNTAVVYENTNKVSGLSQSAQYTASITQQSSGGNGNTACVTQNISLDGSATNTNTKGTTANLQAHQSITINQDVVTGNGKNTAKTAAVLSGSTAICDPNNATLTQNQTLSSTITTKGAVTQNEDGTFSPCGDTNDGGIDYANLCLKIAQNQGTGLGNTSSGANDARFTQTSTQTAIANTPNGPVSQTQSTPLCPNANAPNCLFPGGLVGTINQKSGTSSYANATQVETQCEDAATSGLTVCHTGSNDNDFNGTYTLTQNQYGPVGVGKLRNLHRGSRRVGFSHGKGLGASVQSGGNNNQFVISQTSTQDNDNVAGTQLNTGQADCTSNNGSCQADQTTTVNNAPASDGYTAGSISNLKINCNGQACQTTPPPAPVITGHPVAQTTSTNATFTWTEDATSGVTMKCSIDGGASFQTCDSRTSTSYTGLSHGPHTFVVKAVDNSSSHNESDTDSFSWEIIPYLTFEKTNDGAAAGWSGTPGSSSITLTTGSSSGTYAQFTIHDRNDLTVNDLAVEPTFTTDVYVGAPRYEIDLDNGDYLFGYPPQAGFGSNSWDINCGGSNLSCTDQAFVTWADVQNAEGSATVTDVLIEADFPANFTYSISDFQFDGYHPGDVAP